MKSPLFLQRVQVGDSNAKEACDTRYGKSRTPENILEVINCGGAARADGDVDVWTCGRAFSQDEQSAISGQMSDPVLRGLNGAVRTRIMYVEQPRSPFCSVVVCLY